MKRKFILSILAFVTAVSAAMAQTRETVAVNAGNFEHITISSNLDVVLLTSMENIQSITMDDRAAEKLAIQVSNNTMTISRTGAAGKKNFTIYLYVNKLKTLKVENDAVVRNLGVLNAPDLDLFVGGDAMAHLKTNGKVKAYPLSDSNIRVKYVKENGLASMGTAKKK